MSTPHRARATDDHEVGLVEVRAGCGSQWRAYPEKKISPQRHKGTKRVKEKIM
jgi:hypothetical protein